MPGDYMSPRFEDGEILHLDSDRRPAIGDDVAIHDGPRLLWVGRVVGLAAGALTLRQYNPEDVRTVALHGERCCRVIVGHTGWRDGNRTR
ncbi:MAG: S24 family peptidase [Alphaproteobacteria bacterium]|jgi:phage repressor protein C with HTH and peptisase S24 domain|nr:S24 family peptidase [Alphaproteobacteria bacterium]